MPTDQGAGAVDLRRMTITEYNNTVRDLLQDPSAPFTIALVADQYSDSSTFEVGGSIGDTQAPALLDMSLQLATKAVGNLSAIAGGVVPASTSDTAGVKQFIATLGKRAYRRPLIQAEADDLFTLFQAQLAPPISADLNTALTAVIAGMLMSPSFLYRWELGPNLPDLVPGNPNLIAFNSYEVASRLSYWLWASMPDDALFQAADAGQLSTGAQIAAQMRRMLMDLKAKDGIAEFHKQWLVLTDLPTLNKDNPLFTPQLAQSMLNETREFTWSVLGPSGDGTLKSLLTSSNTFVDQNLATLYGVPNVSGSNLVQVSLNPQQRAGILTQGAFLASRSNPDEMNPILLGAKVTQRLLCKNIQKPTNLVVTPVPPAMPGQPIRQRYAVHGQQVCATQCHSIIDPPGFAFLNYDAIGSYTTMDNGLPIDSTGSMPVGTNTISFQNAVDLVKQLASQPAVADCLPNMWLRYMDRRIEVPGAMGDDPSLQIARNAMGAKNDIREMLVALSNTNAFTVRLQNPGETIK
jgi:hypothetical protein